MPPGNGLPQSTESHPLATAVQLGHLANRPATVPSRWVPDFLEEADDGNTDDVPERRLLLLGSARIPHIVRQSDRAQLPNRRSRSAPIIRTS